MSDQRDDGDTSPPAVKKFRYQQDQIDTMRLYLSTSQADVRFVFGFGYRSTTHVPAHKTLLAVGSKVFEQMFRGRNGYRNRRIHVNDASVAAFKEFLQFFYLTDGNLSAEHVASVLYLGHKYDVKKCLDACVKFLKKDLTDGNVCTTLSLAIRYDQEELMESCERRILANTTDVFSSVAFLQCELRVLAHILRMNLLSCSEVHVFEACMSWVRAESGRPNLSKAIVKEHLGDSFYQIRYASMTIQEFCQLEMKYNAVLSSDFKTLVQLIAKPKRNSGQFNTHPRRINRVEDGYMYCGRSILPSPSPWKWYALDYEERVTFSTDEAVLLDRISFNNMRIGANDPQVLTAGLLVDMTIVEANTSDGSNLKMLANMTADLGSEISTVTMRPQILIRPQFYYTIRTRGFPGNHFFKSYGQHGTVAHPNEINFKFHNDKIVDGKIISVIYGLHFNEITRKVING